MFIQNFFVSLSMLKNIQDLFVSLVDAITSAFDFLVGFAEDIVYIVQLVGTLVLNIPYYVAWLPSTIITIIVGIFTIVVIYKVLGREG